MDVERDPLVNANPARKPTEMIVGQNVANTPFEAFPLNVLTCFNDASLLKASAPSNLSQKSGGGFSRGSQVFLNVSSLITSFYLIPLYLRGPGTIDPEKDEWRTSLATAVWTETQLYRLLILTCQCGRDKCSDLLDVLYIPPCQTSKTIKYESQPIEMRQTKSFLLCPLVEPLRTPSDRSDCCHD